MYRAFSGRFFLTALVPAFLIALILFVTQASADNGTTLAPDVPTTLKFGDVAVGASKTKVLTFTTYGGTLYVDEIWIEGLNASDFKIVKDNMTGGPYAPGTKITAKIRFSPSAVGKRQATFRGRCHAVDGGACTGGSENLVGNGISTTPTATPTVTATPTRTMTPTQTLTPTVTPTPTASPTLRAGCTAKPRRIILEKPQDGETVTVRKVKLDWKNVNCVSWYEVQVRDGSKHGKVVSEKYDLVVSEFKTKRLNTNHTYYWQVSACNALGCRKSDWRTFIVE